MKIEDALEEFMDKFDKFLSIEIIESEIATEKYSIKLPDYPIITLLAQRRKRDRNKKFTIISGINKLLPNLENLLNYLKRNLGTLGEITNSEAVFEKEIAIHGNHLAGVKMILMERLKLPKSQIRVIDEIKP